MPLILSAEALKKWLESSATVGDLKNALSEISMAAFSLHPVSPLISDISQEGESLIKPSQPSDQYGNYTLFN
jgi:putative SOS response-associated peptidase YedK